MKFALFVLPVPQSLIYAAVSFPVILTLCILELEQAFLNEDKSTKHTYNSV